MAKYFDGLEALRPRSDTLKGGVLRRYFLSLPIYDTIMSPNKMNTSESSTGRTRKSSTQRLSLRTPKPFKQRKLPKTLHGVPVEIYGVKWDDFMNGRNATIQPLVSSESAPSSLHVTTPQDMEVNLASSYSCFPPADFVHSQIPASSAPVYLGSDSEHSQVPISFQYDLDDFTSQGEDIFSLTYDPSYHFLLPSPSRSSSTQAGRLSMEHSVEPYQRWLPVDMNTHNSLIPQPSILSYVSNASPTFPGPCNPDNGIYAEIAGSSHLTMTRTVSESANDGTGTTLVPFPTYNANNYYM